MRAEDIMNGYLGSLLLGTTTAVSGEGRAPEIPVEKSMRNQFTNSTTYIALPTELLSQVIK